jgi:hypothetical protein
VIDSISNFVAPEGKIVVVTRGREDDEIPQEVPWALSRKDLSQFEKNGLRQTYFEELFEEDHDVLMKRFVVEYEKIDS